MRYNAETLPDNVLKRMSPEDRKPLGKSGLTQAECQERIDDRSEKQLQRDIADYLRQRGIPFACSRMDKPTTSTIGWPDFTFPFGGKFWSLECKSKTGKLSTEQELCGSLILANGGEYKVVRSLTEVKNWLDKNAPF